MAAAKKKKPAPKSKALKAAKAPKAQAAKKAPAKAAKVTKRASAKKKPAAARAPKRNLSAAEALVLRLPPLSDAQRDAFGDQVSDARCDQLGAKTKSDVVERDAMTFIDTIASTLEHHGDAIRRYGKARLAWLAECVVALQQARSRQSSGRDDSRPVEEALAHATERARAVLIDLKHALEQLASDSEADEQEIDAAAGATDDLVDSLHGVAKLAERWVRRTDREGKALVASVDLRSADVDAAWAAAEDLQDAIDRAAGRAPSSERDTVPVNRAEGRVLYEMGYAMRAFAHAHSLDPRVPKLVPGSGTREALMSKLNGQPIPPPTPAPSLEAPSAMA